ncbi:MAG TPA: glucose 1-dehydrogenase [Acidimicrobiales bacterium]
MSGEATAEPAATDEAAADTEAASRSADGGTGRLAGKVALVTGGASGIGLAVARRFAAEGAAVAVGDVDEDGLAAVADELGDACATLCSDATVEDDQAALVALAQERFGGLDVAVANAGTGYLAPIVDHDLDGWRRIIDLCLTGVFLTIKHAGRAIAARGGGSIITMASLNAVQPARGMSAYCTAKAGVAMLTEVAALELGPSGVRVNAIGPGLVETPLTGAMWAVPGVVDEFVENTALGRFAQPDEIASAALFLASDESAFVTGTLQLVDGGAHIRRYPDIPAAVARMAAPDG